MTQNQQTQQSKSKYKSLPEVLQEMLQKGYGGLGQSNNSVQAVQAQMAAKDPRYAAGNVLGKIANAWLQNWLRNYIDKQTIQTTNSSTPQQPLPDYKEQAIISATPQSQNALQSFSLDGNSALAKKIEDLEEVPYPFVRGM